MARWRFGVAVVVVAAAVAAVAVWASGRGGGNGGDVVAGGDTAEPGQPLADGLVVPDAAELVGLVFPLPVSDLMDGSEPTDRGWAAVLAVTDDPFDAWDGLATQAQGLGVDAPLADTSCTWLVGRGVNGAEYVALAGDGAPTGTVALSCQASGTAAAPGDDGRLLSVGLHLWADDDGRHVTVTAVRPPPGDDQRPGSMAYAGSYAPEPGSPVPLGGPATDADRASVPAFEPPAEGTGPGSPFGSDINCLERGYDQLEVPVGGRLLTVSGAGVAGSGDYAAVLAVDDAEAALADLADQMVHATSAPEHPPELRRASLSDGTEVWELTHSVVAGGGYCQVVADPAAQALLVLPHSD